MATYKVIQDIEAEDKIVGPLSLRQFVFGLAAGLFGYLSFIAVAKGAAFLLVIFLPIFAFTAFFAIPWGGDQPTEIWALAKIRFFLKPRRRIWDQMGAQELVNVTAPKRIERIVTKNLSQTQVESRLSALANTLDSRGWAVKDVNINLNLYNPAQAPAGDGDSDRLIGPSSIPQQVPSVDITAGDDMLDEQNNARAQRLDEMVATTSHNRRQQLIDRMRHTADTAVAPASAPAATQLPAPADYWFLNKPVDLPAVGPTGTATSAIITPAGQPAAGNDMGGGTGPADDPTPDEQQLIERLREQRERTQQAVNYQHMKVIQPLSVQAARAQAAAQKAAAESPNPPAAAPVTPPPDPATIGLAGRDDLNISTLARMANKEDGKPEQDEVVISLHNHSS